LELVICQNCGNILKTRARTCENCNALVSRFGSTPLSSFSPLSKPLSIEINPDPSDLERVLVKRLDVGNGTTDEHVNHFLTQVMGVALTSQSPTSPAVISPQAYVGGGNGGNGGNGGGHNGSYNDPVRAADNSQAQAPPPVSYAPEPAAVPMPPPPSVVQQEPSYAAPSGGNGNTAEVLAQNAGWVQQQEPPPPPPQPVVPDYATAGDGGTPAPQAIAPPDSPSVNNYSEPVAAEPVAAPPPAPEPAPVQPELPSAAPAVVGDNPLPETLTRDAAAISSGANIAAVAQPAMPAPADPVSVAPIAVSQDFFASNQPAPAPAMPPPVESSQAPPPVAPELSTENQTEEEFPKTTVIKGDDDFFSSAPASVRELSSKATIRTTPPKVEVSQNAGLFEPPIGGPVSDSTKNERPEDGEFQKKVTPPLGYQKSGSASRTDLSPADVSGEHKEESDDEAEEPHVPPPHRRSFSGKSPTSFSKSKAHEDDDEDDHKPAGPLDSEMDYLGFRMTKQKAIIVTVCLLIGFFVAFRIFAGITSSLLGGAAGNMPIGGSGQHLTGKWRFAAQLPKSVVKGEMMVHQKGDQIFGEGKDNSGGYFQFQGVAKSNGEIDYNKQYMRGGQPQGKPIHFTGRLDPNQNPPFMQGEYSLSYRRGVGWRGESVTMTNIWEADQIQEMDGNTDKSQEPSAMKERHPLNLADLGLKMAIGMISLVVFVFVVLRTGFGPDGWRNRIAKEKYVPSQYLAPHRKELNELSQPLKPGGVPLGRRCEWRVYFPWEKKDLALTPAIRTVNPHILMLGSGDKGKSRLMAKMITHDIESNDRCIVLIDSDGSLADLITHWVAAHPQAKELSKRVCIIDPTFPEGSLAYNPIEMPDDGDLQGAASSLVYGFKAIYTEPPGSQTQWNAQTANILRNAAVLLMVNNRTLSDLPTLLQDNDFRDVLLEGVEKKRKDRVEYGTLLETWGQYKRLARTDQWITWVEPILNRTTPMLSDPRIRPILTKEKGDINLRNIIKEKKVLIVKIPQGQLDQNANLLGGLLVTGIKQASLSVATREKSAAQPVALYLDEFQNFIEKETFDAITSDTKKFQIGFVGASKSLQDLPEDFRNQLIINVGCMACFSLAKKDGDMLGPQMFRVDGRKKKHETLQNFINPFNTSHNFELISDEEKLNIDRVVGQAERTYFLYRVGTVAGVFHLNTHTFNDVQEKHVNQKIVRKMHGLKSENNGKAAIGAS
jgi:hypothetical protein